MKTASEVLPLSLLSTEKKKKKHIDHRAAGPKESSSKALAHSTHFTGDISSALPEEPGRQIYLFFSFVTEIVASVFFPSVVMFVH